MKTFVVECYWPGLSEEQARDILARIGRVAGEASPREKAWPLGCILVPSDGMALYFLAAPSEAIVRRIGSLAEAPFDRIVEAVHIGFHHQRN
jgi:hypothetical protein